MNYEDHRDIVYKLNPHVVVKYLKDAQWNELPTKRKNVKIFQRETSNDFEQINVPLDKNFLDYKRVMYDVICKIASLEGKSVQQQMLSFLNPNADILKIRLYRKDIEFGDITFDNAIKLYENVKKLLAATASDVINPRKTHSGMPDDSVQKFLSQCRFGQTEIGSYVVPVVCPFIDYSGTEGYQQLSIFTAEDKCANSLTRKVTNTVMANIATIKEKVNNGNYASLVEGEDSISSNFYEALNSLNPNLEDATLEFTAEWSPIVKKNRGPIRSIDISHDYYEPLQGVISAIKSSTVNKTKIIGGVKALTAHPTLDAREFGEIVVAYIGINGKLKTVRAKLNKEDYSCAVQAHQYGKTIQLTGDLKGTSRATMENASLNIIEPF